MNVDEHGRPGKARWLDELRLSVAQQIERCREHLDSVEASLEDPEHPGPLPIESRAGFAAEAALDLAARAWYLQRSTVSCGADAVRDLSGMPWHDNCIRMERHGGDCDPYPMSPLGPAAAGVFSLARSASAVIHQAFRVELRIAQASADGTRPVRPDDLAELSVLAKELDTIVDEARSVSAELHQVEARMGSVQRTAEARLALASGQPPDAPEPGLGGVG
jgi:hypothetical protein